ncbi:hypothetical protein E4N83_08400 [Treponema denticola]|jgi:hypothetical protein|uniref:Lipoprotein n=1 Tax=Treponema denticola H1-T TaxID=999431 RepID=M2C318_TREDN|nr:MULTISPECIES: hypothetical protein [Treponema]EMB27424.1 hypothetical protein HMPREF9727_02140 [Treponema denticola MYR-T]EMB28063.1 hypothetical protein HMPREF9725_02493 [Treponema denticola H1-T]EMB44440.1 hypothetical protein HMPREF9729_01779 [Treponema denticola ASLM]EMD56967.1 hypothetical protein HMPREF9728_00958 [Treponema denticola US-Trep]UTC85666.1 hypothetical protein E4N91_08505 [Treponema denticola]
MKKLLVFVVLMLCFLSCKTKQIQPKIEGAYIQLTDKAQISFKDLPCTVFFSDGTEEKHLTNEDGKVVVQVIEGRIITKVVYDFSDYKRPKGKLLAKEEFSIIRKLKIKPKSLTQEFNIDLEPVKGMQLIIILNVFNIEL